MADAVQTRIDPRTSMGTVALTVRDLDRSLRFYRDVLGFYVIEAVDGVARVGTSTGRVLLELHEVPSATPRPLGTTGLYHVAILVPTRGDLGRLMERVSDRGIRYGHSDHLVSEALYLSDPDGNGLELYRDRPRDEWQWREGRVMMAVDPLNLYTLFEEGRSGDWEGLPEDTVVGHVHLNVGSLTRASEFYHAILGFDIVAELPGALFVSAGGYHHHLGLNVWESAGGGPASESSVGLRRYTIDVADRGVLDDIRARLVEAGVDVTETVDGIEVFDPWRNRVRIRVG